MYRDIHVSSFWPLYITLINKDPPTKILFYTNENIILFFDNDSISSSF